MKSIAKITIWISCFFISSLIYAQEDYNLLFLKGEYKQILTKSQVLETPEDYYWNSTILDKQGQTLEAIELLNRGLVEFDSIEIIESLLSDFLYKTGQYSKAKPLLVKQISKSDNFIKYINVLEFEGDYRKAIELLQIEIQKDSLNLDYLQHLGKNYSTIDSIDLAIEVFSKISIINPNDQLNALKLANLLLISKDFVRAIEVCDIGLASDSINKKLIKLKGVASFNNSDFQTAELCFNYLHARGDSTVFILKHIGISEFKNKSFRASREHLEQAFLLDSIDFKICYMLGKCYTNTADPEKGLYFFERVDSLLQPDPETLSALYNEKQSIYSAIENYEMALQSYQKAFNYNPKPEYIFYIASLYQNRLDNPKEALKNYEKFLSLLPEKTDSENTGERKNQMTITLRNVAERNIVEIKEELFFKGELE